MQRSTLTPSARDERALSEPRRSPHVLEATRYQRIERPLNPCRSSTSGAKVSWRVKALRNDLWVQKRAVPMEVIANGRSIQTRAMPVEIEKGAYRHAEFYGLSAERGMNYDAEHERAAHAEGDLPDRAATERPASRTLPAAMPH